MTSFKQFEANRRNASKSTGPKSEEGKQRSRCNAVRHGLTADTVIGNLEDAKDYKAFEAVVIADYDAQSAIERELVLRLASLLWRLRRATAIETGLFEMDTDRREFTSQNKATNGRASPQLLSPTLYPEHLPTTASHRSCLPARTSELASRYLSLADMPSFVLDRLNRYELTLWRQAEQILVALDALDRRKPQERRCAFPRSAIPRMSYDDCGS
jgi:hypothetical protein